MTMYIYASKWLVFIHYLALSGSSQEQGSQSYSIVKTFVIQSEISRVYAHFYSVTIDTVLHGVCHIAILLTYAMPFT